MKFIILVILFISRLGANPLPADSLLAGINVDSLKNDSLLIQRYRGLHPPKKYRYRPPGLKIKTGGDTENPLILGKPYTPKVAPERMDLRGTQMYTPSFVRKQHLMDMGRDPGTFWLSPYTVVFLAAAMLDRYYLNEQYAKLFADEPPLTSSNLLSSEPYWKILKALWKNAPQGYEELRKNPLVGFRFSDEKFKEAVNNLSRNRIVEKTKQKNGQILIRPKLSAAGMKKLIEEMLDNPENSEAKVRDGLYRLLKKTD
jgi:hypothetical protein